ncbi:uncharacterized protein LOC120842374 [Ixodes scapularis]|uniref:uncharacterized protein LOC120842374 n=1 Tax=Ixodes scapularis TaxID=6945 RepID=UPI001A9E4D23|nr:uncharacterized protein LOC120842374 [Ixodes scapularis]
MGSALLYFHGWPSSTSVPLALLDHNESRGPLLTPLLHQDEPKQETRPIQEVLDGWKTAAVACARLRHPRGGDKNKEQEPPNRTRDIERALSKWLTSAPDKEGGRQLRAAPKGRSFSDSHRTLVGSCQSGGLQSGRHKDGGACSSHHVGSASSPPHASGPRTHNQFPPKPLVQVEGGRTDQIPPEMRP